MIPTKVFVTHMLEQAKTVPRNLGWVQHSFAVGNTAGTIANALNKAGYDLDIEKATLLGYLHDIGKMVGPYTAHMQNGYHYLKELGFPEEYCDICIIHSYITNDPFLVISEIFDNEEIIQHVQNHQHTIYERLVNLCDLMCGLQTMTVDQRLIDVISRHGTCKSTQKHVQEVHKLKQYFDEMLGYNLYSLFPSIYENL